MLAPPEGPAPAPALVAPALVVPEFAPDMAPGPGLEITPELGPDLAPGFAPLEADGPGPLDMPEDAPYEAPEEGPELGPEDAPVEAPGPAPLDAIEPELEEIDSEIIPTEVEPPAPAPTPVPAPVELPAGTFQDRIVPGPDGKYAVCINGDSDQWGKWDIFRNCGIRVFANGDVELAEWFGGFDGYPAVDPADGHETCFNSAVGDMFGVPKCDFSRTTDGIDDYGDEVEAIECEENADGSQCICTADDKVPSLKSQRGWPGNVGIKKFLETMRERANPTNYDFPQDEEIADAGGRAENVALVQAVFKDMITVSQC